MLPIENVYPQLDEVHRRLKKSPLSIADGCKEIINECESELDDKQRVYLAALSLAFISAKKQEEKTDEII